jgi:chromosome segregation protein
VHLRAIKVRGFKSFPDPVEVRLDRGVGVIVGPNGSGKSNVADAIRWAAGSLSPNELRAEKPDDVLFAGAAGRGPADFCEVELLFDNQAHDGPFEYSELSIARRLHRGGEGQYLVNKTPVRRIDLSGRSPTSASVRACIRSSAGEGRGDPRHAAGGTAR